MRSELQWMTVEVKNQTETEITLMIDHLGGGRFFQPPENTGTEVDSPDGTKIATRGSFVFGACGRTGAAYGTYGNFSLLNLNKVVMVQYYWNCPWGASNNEFYVSQDNDDYVTKDVGANRTSHGPLGHITLTVRNWD